MGDTPGVMSLVISKLKTITGYQSGTFFMHIKKGNYKVKIDPRVRYLGTIFCNCWVEQVVCIIQSGHLKTKHKKVFKTIGGIPGGYLDPLSPLTALLSFFKILDVYAVRFCFKIYL